MTTPNPEPYNAEGRVTFGNAINTDHDTAAALFARMHNYKNLEPHASATRWLDTNITGYTNILDLGPGNGEDADQLTQLGHNVTGVDVRTDMCTPHGGWTLLQGDAEHIPVPDHTIDYLRANRVIHHIPSHERFLTEAKRILAPDGMLRLTFPDRSMTCASNPDVQAILRTLTTMKGIDTANPAQTHHIIQNITNTGLHLTRIHIYYGTFHGDTMFNYAYPKPSIHTDAAYNLLGKPEGNLLHEFAEQAKRGHGWVTVAIACIEATP